MKGKGGLGRGLAALIPQESSSENYPVPLDAIQPNPHQPRDHL